MTKTLEEVYDHFADNYEANRALFDMSEVFDAFYQHLQGAEGELLDLGCGAGEPWAKYFVDRGWQVTGVDFSRRMLELAARYVPQMRTVAGDMREVRFEADRFDVITAIYSLFHVPEKDHRLLFTDIHRWLTPGGKFLFTYATSEYTGQLEFDGYKEFMGQQLYYSHTSPDRLNQLLEKCGFTIESADYREIGNETFLWVTAKKR